MVREPQARPVHLVGSLSLASAREVFEIVSAILGPLVRHIPDGETGERSMWIWTQIERIERVQGLLAAGSRTGIVEYPPGVETPYWRIEERTKNRDISFGPLGYAAWASSSYQVFRQLREEGEVAPRARLQVTLPTPFAVVYTWIAASDRASVLPAYEKALVREIRHITSAIPNEEVVLQWDVAMEFIVLERPQAAKHHSMEELIDNLLRVDRAIPPDIGVGLHLCYGDFGGIHNVDLHDTRLMVEFANRISILSPRCFRWIHIPVPPTADETYFDPLVNLRLSPGTQLYLGLVHEADGVQGGRRRIEIAQSRVSNFGIATECGMGRRKPEAIPDPAEATPGNC